jgi:hypothetical protein
MKSSVAKVCAKNYAYDAYGRMFGVLDPSGTPLTRFVYGAKQNVPWA